MASFDYERSRAAAERLIARFGQAASLRRTTASGADYDPALTVEDFPCLLVDLDHRERRIDESSIRQDDRMVYLSAAGLSVTPTLADRLLIGGAEHAIVSVQPLSPDGTIIVWQLQVRG
jgi:hypothetical protein